jgi:hypothetical protein
VHTGKEHDHVATPLANLVFDWLKFQNIFSSEATDRNDWFHNSNDVPSFLINLTPMKNMVAIENSCVTHCKLA